MLSLTNFGGMSAEAVERSQRLFAEKVLPRINRSAPSSAAVS
jgi:hypothetical protein